MKQLALRLPACTMLVVFFWTTSGLAADSTNVNRGILAIELSPYDFGYQAQYGAAVNYFGFHDSYGVGGTACFISARKGVWRNDETALATIEGGYFLRSSSMVVGAFVGGGAMLQMLSGGRDSATSGNDFRQTFDSSPTERRIRPCMSVSLILCYQVKENPSVGVSCKYFISSTQPIIFPGIAFCVKL